MVIADLGLLAASLLLKQQVVHHFRQIFHEGVDMFYWTVLHWFQSGSPEGMAGPSTGPHDCVAWFVGV